MYTKENDLLFNKEDIKKHMRERNERAAERFRMNFELAHGKTFGVQVGRSKKFKR